MDLKLPAGSRWRLTLQGGITVREIVVDSSAETSGISINTTGGSTEGIAIEQLQLPEEEREFEMHKSFEESGNQSNSQLVCSGQFSMEKKQSQ